MSDFFCSIQLSKSYPTKGTKEKIVTVFGAYTAFTCAG